MNHKRFFAELKRRKVFQVAAVYGATAFVVLQVVDLLQEGLNLPQAVLTVIIVLAFAGFPIAIVLAWAYESTSEGVRPTQDPLPGELTHIASMPVLRRWPSGIAALIGVVALVWAGWWVIGRTDADEGSRGGRGAIDRQFNEDGQRMYASIAVLPFVNLSQDSDGDFFGDGLAEELLNALSGIEGLKVAARTSAFAFKGQDVDVRLIGDTLAVETVLEGSVRKSGDRLRISAQLIDTENGFHLWSDTYDRALTDLFAVQDELARSIVGALAVPLGAEEQAVLYRGGTDDIAAYEEYLAGRQKWATRDTLLLVEAVRHFERAIASDSNFALAWSGYADAVDALAWRSAAYRHLVPGAKAAAQRALLLVPDLAEAHASLGVLYGDFDRDFALAEAEFRRAIELKPSYSPARQWLADYLQVTGRVPEALEQGRIAVELDPLAYLANANLGFGLVVAQQWDEAWEQLQRTLPLAIANRQMQAVVYALAAGEGAGVSDDEMLGLADALATTTTLLDREDAVLLIRAIRDSALRDSTADLVRRLEVQEGYASRGIAQLLALIGEYDAAMGVLEIIERENITNLHYMFIDPVFEPLHEDPRFLRMAEEYDLPVGYQPEGSGS